MIGLSYGIIPQRDFDDHPGSFQSKWGGISAVIPVSRSLRMGDGGPSLQQFSLTASLRRNNTEVPTLTLERTVTTAALGASWVYLSGSKQLYTISGSVGIAEDKLIGASPELRFRLTALGSHRFSEAAMLLYGANYSAVFGRDLLLPILGMNFKMSSDWSGTVILPFSMSVRYAATKDIILKAGLSAMGERVRVKNHTDYADEPSVLQLRTTGAKASLTFIGKISNDFRMDVEAGALAHRNLELTSVNKTLLSASLNSSGFFSVGFRFFFSMTDEPEDLL